MVREFRQLTPRMNDGRLLIEPKPHSGSWNMAVDEVLLEGAIERGQCSVRVYQWSEPTLSLGYFQESDVQTAAPSLDSLPRVRRLSGGGAILHHHEITYSCAVPARHALARQPQALYQHVHSAIIDVLALGGIDAALRGKPHSGHQDAFLCFSRGDRNDIVLNGSKIVGSAQRRRRGAVLQHGSIIVRKSAHAPHISGILDLTQAMTSALKGAIFNGLGNDLGCTISTVLGIPYSFEQLSQIEFSRATDLQQAKYSTLKWR